MTSPDASRVLYDQSVTQRVTGSGHLDRDLVRRTRSWWARTCGGGCETMVKDRRRQPT